MNLLRNLSIGGKLMLAPLVTLLLLVVGVVAGILALHHQQQTLSVFTQEKLARYRVAAELESHVNLTYVQALRLFSAMRNNASETVVAQAQKQVEALVTEAVTRAEQTGNVDLKAAAGRLAVAMKDTLELATVDINSAEMALSNVDTQFGDLRQRLQAQVKQELQNMHDAETVAATWGDRAKAVLAGALVLSLLLSIGLTLALKRVVLAGVRRLERDATALREGDLTRRSEAAAQDEIGRAATAFAEAAAVFNATLLQAQDTAQHVAEGSSEIAGGNAELSARTERQAAALQQTAMSMSGLSEGMRQNVQQLHSATQLVQASADVALRGGEQMGRVVSGMEQLRTQAQQVQEISSVIDAIAFQTNILALNAAVEASRAGEHGRGFAVVATEVRTLAQRSAQSAREIRQLIGRTVEQIGQNAGVVASTHRTMQEVVEQSRSMRELMQQLRGNTEQQARSVDEVHEAVRVIDDDTQRNAALVEQLSAASASLRESSGTLAQAIGRFRLSRV
jgi:methyl-accepting chemotaxis protein